MDGNKLLENISRFKLNMRFVYIALSSLTLLGSILISAWAQAPQNAMIVFTSNRDGNKEVYAMDADGGNQRNLTNNPASDTEPAWSPDGQKIAFESDRDGNYEIYIMDADGNNQRRINNIPAANSYPSWSPDGKKIAFGSNRDGNDDIYVIDVDGSNLCKLTNSPGDDYFPMWFDPAFASKSVSSAGKLATAWGKIKGD